MELRIPDFALVVLIGPSGAGKSTFAARHFRPTEIISSDRCRGWVADDESDQDATKDAFELLHFMAAKRLAGRRLTVVDATSVRPEDRKPLVELARKYHALPVAIALDPTEEVGQTLPWRPWAWSFAHVSRSPSVRLNTSAPGSDSGSGQK